MAHSPLSLSVLGTEFAETKVRSSEDHLVLAFQAEKDVGLGLFLRDRSSFVSIGVRFVEFRSQSNISMKSDPDVNAALLFGRQKAKIHHQTTGRFHSSFAPDTALPITYQRSTAPDHTRSRDVVVPNVGGFAGFSVRYPSAKVSFGYKADFFFGAVDGGIDVRRTEDVGFHGPYASVSIGLGG